MSQRPLKVGFYVQVFESLGVEYLSAALKEAGHETCIFFDPVLGNDVIYQNRFLASFLSLEDMLLEKMLGADLDLLAFSVTTDDYAGMLHMANHIKEHSEIPIVFGGIHVSCVPERVLVQPAVDYVIVGEGEQALVDLAEALSRGEPVEQIPNVGYCSDEGIHINPPRSLVENLDSLPFPDKALFWEKAEGFKKSIYGMIASRGCLYSCTYCCNSSMRSVYKGKGRWHRRRSVDNVLAELEWARNQYDFERVRFWDDNFVDDEEWLEEFAEKYRACIGLPFFVWTSPSHTTDKVVRLLKKAGCQEISMGVQTCYESTRKKYLHRSDTNEEISKAIATVRDAKIFLSTANILQLPGQTLDEARDLAAFYCENRVDLAYVFLLRYYPRTRIVDIATQEGILSSADVEGLEKAETRWANSVAGPHDDLAFLKIRDFIVLSNMLPRFLIRFLLKNDRYRYLPVSKTTSYLTVTCGIAKRLFTSKRHMALGFRLSEYIFHYLRFIWLKLRWKLGKVFAKSGCRVFRGSEKGA